jgi:hypothetical protein
MNKTEKAAAKVVKEIRETPVNPLPNNTEAAEIIKRRRTTK